jgi:hypothetical protein
MIATVAFAQATQTAAATQDAAPLGPKWNELLSRLASDDFKVRDAAQKELAALPVGERPLLGKLADQATDPEVKARLLARAASMDEALALNPLPVSLDLHDATLRQVFQALSKQTGLTIHGWPDYGPDQPNSPMNKRITVKIDHQPLWAALREISKQAPLSPMHNFDSDLQVQVGSDGVQGMSASSGPVLIVFSNMVRQYTVTLGEKAADAKTQNSFQANFELMIDPRVRLDYSPKGGAINLSEATDDKGNSLLPPQAQRRAGCWWQSGGYANVSLPLHYPENPGTRLAVLKGTLVYTAQTQAHHLDVKIPATVPVIGQLDGMTATFNKFSVQNDVGTADVKLERGTMSLENWQRFQQSNGFSARVQLLDADGAAAQSAGYGGGGGNNMLNYQYQFNLRNREQGPKFKPATLRITLTTKTQDVTVPFEFHDIPLP